MYSALYKTWLQAALVVSDLFFFYLPMVPWGLKCMYSYYMVQRPSFTKAVCTTTESLTSSQGHERIIKNLNYSMDPKNGRLRNTLDVYPRATHERGTYALARRVAVRTCMRPYPVENSPVAVVIHGGGWGAFSKEDHHFIGRTRVVAGSLNTHVT